jgi:hypothetical protein
MAVLRQHMQAMTEESRSTKPVEATAPVVRLRPWRRRVPIALASVAAGVAAVAGASQFVPQAAVSTHNVANQTNATLTSRLPQVGTSSPLPTGQTLPGVDTTTQSTTEQSTTTTTTSTTLLPPIPCLTDGSGRVVTPTLPRRVDALPDILHCP